MVQGAQEILEGGIVIEQQFLNVKVPKNHLEGLFSYVSLFGSPFPEISMFGWEPMN